MRRKNDDVNKITKHFLYKALRRECHEYLDGLWETSRERQSIYRWLSFKMHIPLKDCHIGRMNLSQLYKARKILRSANKKHKKKYIKQNK